MGSLPRWIPRAARPTSNQERVLGRKALVAEFQHPLANGDSWGTVPPPEPGGDVNPKDHPGHRVCFTECFLQTRYFVMWEEKEPA